jgi:hypothetical protein
MQAARLHCISGPNDEPVDLGNPDAFWGLNVDNKASAADFRTVVQRVRQHEFVRQYLALVAQVDTTGDASGDDVTVMMNMTARLDRMWRRDFQSHCIDTMERKMKLQSDWQLQFGKHAVRATVDMSAVMALGVDGGVSQQRAMEIIRNVGSAQSYLKLTFPWPERCSPELRLLRHELNVFNYNREAVPLDMERLALDIVAVEARCVQVFDTLDTMPATDEAHRAWAIVCFAMFTVFDLRPIFMSIAA